MESPKVTVRLESLIVGYYRELMVVIWRQQPQALIVQELGDQYHQMVRRFPQGFCVLTIVEDGVPLPDSAARKAITDAEARGMKCIRAIVGVQEASGFLGASIRSVLLGISLAMRVPYKHHISSNVLEAAGWLSQHLDRMDKSEIVDTVYNIRRNPEQYR
jgi:hypothetical protein